MKLLLIIPVLAITLYLVFRAAPVALVAEPAAIHPAALHQGKMSQKMEPAVVFKQALWRRPAPDDRILHAERREWTQAEGGGVAHWQWFLAVEPGEALKTWLKERNPFALRPAGSAATSSIKAAPDWFPRDFENHEILAGGSGGNLVFLFSRRGGTFYATGSGTGFAAGAPEPPVRVSPSTVITQGRLPLTPPPNPNP